MPRDGDRRGRVRRLALVDGARPGAHRRRDPGAQPGQRLGRRSGRPPPTSRPRRRTSSTPTARATSATRRRAGSRSASRATTAGARRRAGVPENDWTGELRALRRAAERARPRRGVRGDRQPGRRSAATTPTSSPTTGTTATAPSGSATCSSRAGGDDGTVSPTTARPPARRPQPDGAGADARTCCASALPRGYYADGQRLLELLGLRPARRAAPRRPTTTWCGATCSR